jgi:hypothetical protein
LILWCCDLAHTRTHPDVFSDVLYGHEQYNTGQRKWLHGGTAVPNMKNRGRAIALAWRVLRHVSATVRFTDYIAVLDQAKSCLPADLTVVLLADRGCVDAEFSVVAAGMVQLLA